MSDLCYNDSLLVPGLWTGCFPLSFSIGWLRSHLCPSSGQICVCFPMPGLWACVIIGRLAGRYTCLPCVRGLVVVWAAGLVCCGSFVGPV